DSRRLPKEEFKGSVYERAVRQGSPLVIHDLTAMPDRTAVDDEIIQSGARNLVVAPLLYQDRVIGTFELESPHPGDLNVTHLPKLHEVLPLFSMAVQRSMEELNTRIQALIKEKCTAIHPVVEWRFRKAVLTSIERHATGADVERLFDHLQGFGPAVRERIEAYRAALDPRFGTVYARRKLFEESVTRIADTISAYLDLEEQAAQGMFPHYFEKQKTDGVDYQ